jgi:methyltransferase (TIGR00027 family)
MRFSDKQRITAHPDLHQIVLVAAGLDTRAYRLVWPAHTRLFELDQAAVLNRKHMVLDQAGAHPTCDRRTIGVDLTTAWKADLLRAGFEPDQPSGWLLEGFLFYLPNETVTRLLDAVTELAAPGSWLGFDVINSSMLTSPLTKTWVEMQANSGAPWIGTMNDPKAFLEVRGWKAALTQAGQPDANHGRWQYPVIPVDMPNMPHNWLVTAQRV